jgi:hypothetical protein
MRCGWKTEGFMPYQVYVVNMEKWHDAGTKMQKQNVFDDFIARRILDCSKYTSSHFLARWSNGLLKQR